MTDAYYLPDQGLLDTACGPQLGAEVCSVATGCMKVVQLPDRMVWTGASPVWGRAPCPDAYVSGDSYVVPAQHNSCMAQYGPYVNNLVAGRYVVGFKIDAWGDGAYATFDVAKNVGAVIQSRDKEWVSGDGLQCILVGPVDLGPCENVEFRVKYESAAWYQTAHTLQIYGTAVMPEGYNPCDYL